MSDSTRQSVLFDEGFSRPIVAAFDADGVTSDGGAVLLRAADRRLGLTTALAGCVADDRDSERVVHSLAALIRQRVFSIALGYPQADAARRLRDDPAIGLAVHGGRRGAVPLASQPTLSRLENAPTGRELLAMGDELLRSAGSSSCKLTIRDSSRRRQSVSTSSPPKPWVSASTAAAIVRARRARDDGFPPPSLTGRVISSALVSPGWWLHPQDSRITNRVGT